MNEFIQLRQRAREKRDKELAEIQANYEAVLVHISQLEQDLLGKMSSKYVTISSCIDALIPTDSPFTSEDILSGLKAKNPNRVWRTRSIHNRISQLRDRGIIRRVRKAHGRNEPAVYVRANAEAGKRPFEDMTMEQVVRQVLTSPMTQTELSVRMREAGYDTMMDPKRLRAAVEALIRSRAGFKREGQKWSVAG